MPRTTAARNSVSSASGALRRRPLWWLVVALLAIMLTGLQIRLWFGEGSVRHVRDLRERVAELEEENAVLAERNRLMAADVQELKQGLDKIEEIARRDLGMIREGETFFMVLDPEEDRPDESSR